jgi:hypothetical protein
MTTLYKVRRLTQVGHGVVDRSTNVRGAPGAFMAMSDQAGAVYDVASTDAELTHEGVLEALKNGQLRPNDLVFADGVWSSLLESMAFGDEAAARQTANGRPLLIFGAFLALLIIAGVVAAILR